MNGAIKTILRSWLWILLVTVAAPLLAQQNPLDPGKPDAPVPQITFELRWRAADPQWYQVSIEPTGPASYQSQPQAQDSDTPSDPYVLRFIASEATRTRIFAMAKDLNYFQGNFESKNNKIARTGDKTLTYRFGDKVSSTTLNYSDNQEMNRLIDVFQKMSLTFELSRKLDYDLRFDKLGLERDLKSLEQMDKDHNLIELQVIAPTLERITGDTSVMNISRQRARRLLESTASGGSR